MKDISLDTHTKDTYINMRRKHHVYIFNPLIRIHRSTMNSWSLAPGWFTRDRLTGNTFTNMASVAKEAARMLCIAGKTYKYYLLSATLIRLTRVKHCLPITLYF